MKLATDRSLLCSQEEKWKIGSGSYIVKVMMVQIQGVNRRRAECLRLHLLTPSVVYVQGEAFTPRGQSRAS